MTEVCRCSHMGGIRMARNLTDPTIMWSTEVFGRCFSVGLTSNTSCMAPMSCMYKLNKLGSILMELWMDLLAIPHFGGKTKITASWLLSTCLYLSHKEVSTHAVADCSARARARARVCVCVRVCVRVRVRARACVSSRGGIFPYFGWVVIAVRVVVLVSLLIKLHANYLYMELNHKDNTES